MFLLLEKNSLKIMANIINNMPIRTSEIYSMELSGAPKKKNIFWSLVNESRMFSVEILIFLLIK